MRRVDHDLVAIVGGTGILGDAVEEGPGIFLQLPVPQYERLVVEQLLHQLYLGIEIHILLFPEALVVVQVQEPVKRLHTAVLHIAAVLRGDPAVVSPQHDDDAGMGIFFRDLAYLLVELTVELAGDEVFGVAGGVDDLREPPVTGPLDVTDPLELGKKPVLQVGGSRFAQPYVAVQFKVVAPLLHGKIGSSTVRSGAAKIGIFQEEGTLTCNKIYLSNGSMG